MVLATILKCQKAFYKNNSETGKRDKIVLKKVPSVHNTTLEELVLELL